VGGTSTAANVTFGAQRGALPRQQYQATSCSEEDEDVEENHLPAVERSVAVDDQGSVRDVRTPCISYLFGDDGARSVDLEQSPSTEELRAALQRLESRISYLRSGRSSAVATGRSTAAVGQAESAMRRSASGDYRDHSPFYLDRVADNEALSSAAKLESAEEFRRRTGDIFWSDVEEDNQALVRAEVEASRRRQRDDTDTRMQHELHLSACYGRGEALRRTVGSGIINIAADGGDVEVPHLSLTNTAGTRRDNHRPVSRLSLDERESLMTLSDLQGSRRMNLREAVHGEAAREGFWRRPEDVFVPEGPVDEDIEFRQNRHMREPEVVTRSRCVKSSWIDAEEDANKREFTSLDSEARRRRADEADVYPPGSPRRHGED
jgi:hypothetical protein